MEVVNERLLLQWQDMQQRNKRTLAVSAPVALAGWVLSLYASQFALLNTGPSMWATFFSAVTFVGAMIMTAISVWGAMTLADSMPPLPGDNTL